MGVEVTIITNHVTLKNLFEKDVRPRLIQWDLLLQEFNLEIKAREVSKMWQLMTYPGWKTKE